MKRELKVTLGERQYRALDGNRKAHPDEKGTERLLVGAVYEIPVAYRKAHPDEKGTESIYAVQSLDCLYYRKAHPDEKGTERSMYFLDTTCYCVIARPIPMKRELKEEVFDGDCLGAFTIARPIPMKRELKVNDVIGALECCKLDRKAHPDEKGTESFGCRCNSGRRCYRIARPIPMKRELKVLPHTKRRTKPL